MASHAIYMCRACGHLYDQAAGEPDQGIAPGTDIDELSADWRCPECGANKNALERII
jgi:rubredoxin-NAD+ reductase